MAVLRWIGWMLVGVASVLVTSVLLLPVLGIMLVGSTFRDLYSSLADRESAGGPDAGG